MTRCHVRDVIENGYWNWLGEDWWNRGQGQGNGVLLVRIFTKAFVWVVFNLEMGMPSFSNAMVASEKMIDYGWPMMD